jgi:3-oxoacyl-[acyl-carrier protein] reductase
VTRSAIVTGASRGIGRGIALALAREGYAVTAGGRQAERLESLEQEAAAAGGSVRGTPSDVRDPDAADRLVAAHLETSDDLDLLVIGAGAGIARPLADMTTELAERSMQINYLAPLRLLVAARPALVAAAARTGSAKVVVLSSLAAHGAEPWLSAYSASKAALTSLVRSVNVEWASDGVRATAISPGYVDTDMSEWVRDRIPPEEMIQVSDVVELVLALARLGPSVSVPDVVLSRPGTNGLQA